MKKFWEYWQILRRHGFHPGWRGVWTAFLLAKNDNFLGPEYYPPPKEKICE